MIDSIGEILPYAIGVALSPLPMIAIVLLLLTPHGRAAGTAFAIGRFVGILTVVSVVVLLSDLVSESTGSTTAIAILRIVLGITMMAFALVKFRGRPQGDDTAELPGWLSSIEGMSITGALRFGLLITVVNPKELAFGIAGGLTIGNSGLATTESIVVVIAYTVLASLSMTLPVFAFLIAGDRMVPPLQSARNWLMHNNAVIVSVVLLILGAMVLGGGISKL